MEAHISHLKTQDTKMYLLFFELLSHATPLNRAPVHTNSEGASGGEKSSEKLQVDAQPSSLLASQRKGDQWSPAPPLQVQIWPEQQISG